MADEGAAEEVGRPEKTLDRQIRAFHWVRLLAEVPERLAGREGEREAARRVEAWLHEIGFQEVAQGPAPGEPERPARLVLHLGLGALGAWLGGGAGLALLALVWLSFRRELRDGGRWLSRGLPASDSLYVVARAGSDRPRRRVVLSASLDAHRAGRLFSAPVAAWLGARSRTAAGPLVLAERGLQAGLVWAAASLLGAGGVLFDALGVAVVGGLALGTAICLEWARAAPSPGADDASGAAAMLTAGEQLLAQLRDDTELWLVAGGGSHAGATGLRAVLDLHPEWCEERTLLLHFERVGAAHLHYVASEGALLRLEHPPRLRELARRLAESGAYGEVTPVDWAGETDARVAGAAGLHALALVSRDAGGAPRGDRAEGDAAGSLDLETVVRAADFGAALIVASWRGEADPLAIV